MINCPSVSLKRNTVAHQDPKPAPGEPKPCTPSALGTEPLAGGDGPLVAAAPAAAAAAGASVACCWAAPEIPSGCRHTHTMLVVYDCVCVYVFV